MTCIVGLIDENLVYIGGDSAAIDTESGDICSSQSKVFINEDYLIGYAGSFRKGQILQYHFIPPKFPKSKTNNLLNFMITKFVPDVQDALESNGYSIEEDNEENDGSNFLVAFRNSLFLVDYDYHVHTSMNEYISIGSGASYALGSLHTSINHFSPLLRVTHALEAAEHHCAFVRRPFTILTT